MVDATVDVGSSSVLLGIVNGKRGELFRVGKGWDWIRC